MNRQCQNGALRRRLQEATQAEDGSQYLALLNAAAIRDCPNTIALLDSPYPIERYTYFVHVFEFTEKPEYATIGGRVFNVVFAGPSFAHWLLDKQLLTEVDEVEARDGDRVFYFNDEERVKHGGLNLGSHRVESKWGKGNLFQHDLFEVPESYGGKARSSRDVDR